MRKWLSKNLSEYVFVFAIASVVGTLYEEIFILVWNLINTGQFVLETRTGTLIGPFSPIYGVGAVIMLALIKRFGHGSVWRTFALSAVAGGTFEYLASLLQELFTGTRSWDYSEHFLNLNGRVSLQVVLIWGAAGMLLMYIFYPLVKWATGKIPAEKVGMVAVWLAVFLVLDIGLTYFVLFRQSLRRMEVPATTPISRVVDTVFPDEYLQRRFPNMVKPKIK